MQLLLLLVTKQEMSDILTTTGIKEPVYIIPQNVSFVYYQTNVLQIAWNDLHETIQYWIYGAV